MSRDSELDQMRRNTHGYGKMKESMETIQDSSSPPAVPAQKRKAPSNLASKLEGIENKSFKRPPADLNQGATLWSARQASGSVVQDFDNTDQIGSTQVDFYGQVNDLSPVRAVILPSTYKPLPKRQAADRASRKIKLNGDHRAKPVARLKDQIFDYTMPVDMNGVLLWKLDSAFVNDRTKDKFSLKGPDLYLQIDSLSQVSLISNNTKILHYKLDRLNGVWLLNHNCVGAFSGSTGKLEVGFRFTTSVKVNPLFADEETAADLEKNGSGLNVTLFNQMTGKQQSDFKSELETFLDKLDECDVDQVQVKPEAVQTFKNSVAYTGRSRNKSAKEVLNVTTAPIQQYYQSGYKTTRTTRNSSQSVYWKPSEVKQEPIKDTIVLDDDDDNNKDRKPARKKYQSYAQLTKEEPVEILVYPIKGQSISYVSDHDKFRLIEGEYLNDIIVQFYLNYIRLELLQEDVAGRVQFFTSFFYERLTQEDQKTPYDRIKSWTRRMGEDLLDKDFWVIPVNEHMHWFTAIVCYPKRLLERAKSKDVDGFEVVPDQKSKVDTEQDCVILILDSLKSTSGRPLVIRNLKQFVVDEIKERTSIQCSTSDIRGVGANVPQQPNGCDCGVYMLHFIELFLTQEISSDCAAFKPRKFELKIIHDNFAKLVSRDQKLRNNWFKHAAVRDKRPELMDLIDDLSKTYLEQKEPMEVKDGHESADSDIIIVSTNEASKPPPRRQSLRKQANPKRATSPEVLVQDSADDGLKDVSKEEQLAIMNDIKAKKFAQQTNTRVNRAPRIVTSSDSVPAAEKVNTNPSTGTFANVYKQADDFLDSPKVSHALKPDEQSQVKTVSLIDDPVDTTFMPHDGGSIVSTDKATVFTREQESSNIDVDMDHGLVSSQQADVDKALGSEEEDNFMEVDQLDKQPGSSCIGQVARQYIDKFQSHTSPYLRVAKDAIETIKSSFDPKTDVDQSLPRSRRRNSEGCITID